MPPSIQTRDSRTGFALRRQVRAKRRAEDGDDKEAAAAVAAAVAADRSVISNPDDLKRELRAKALLVQARRALDTG
jgi:hypothetical protein